jgi:hypothetical protein
MRDDDCETRGLVDGMAVVVLIIVGSSETPVRKIFGDHGNRGEERQCVILATLGNAL